MDKLGEQIKKVTLIREATRSVKLRETGLCISQDQIESIRKIKPVAEELKRFGIFPESLRNFEGKLEILRKYGIEI